MKEFTLVNARTGEEFQLDSSELRNKIINETNSVYEDTQVLPERTGLRPKELKEILKDLDYVTIQSNVYVVTTLSRINSDKNTRYMILVDGLNYDYKINDIITENIPIYLISYQKDDTNELEMSYLSFWFRKNMGRAFSFIDIDYLLVNKNLDRVILIEEKVGKNSMLSLGYGQSISYLELVNDIISKKNAVIFIFTQINLNTESVVKYCSIGKDSKVYNIKNIKLNETTMEELLRKIQKFLGNC